MKTKTELFLDLWLEARTRFTNQLQDLTTNDVRKKLLPSQNSVGFLIRHIGDVELLFAKNVFGNANVKVIAKTVSTKYDTGEWTNLEELKQYIDTSYESLKSIIEKQTEADWETNVSTKEFGTKTKAEAFGRIISHTTYHAGQIAIINKYGTI
ncbi:MAG: DinB family protein [Chitinophagaceae bacterium]|nr:DinB family protein [Chitinophagaceae bacterium]